MPKMPIMEICLIGQTEKVSAVSGSTRNGGFASDGKEMTPLKWIVAFEKSRLTKVSIIT